MSCMFSFGAAKPSKFGVIYEEFRNNNYEWHTHTAKGIGGVRYIVSSSSYKYSLRVPLFIIVITSFRFNGIRRWNNLPPIYNSTNISIQFSNLITDLQCTHSHMIPIAAIPPLWVRLFCIQLAVHSWVPNLTMGINQNLALRTEIVHVRFVEYAESLAGIKATHWSCHSRPKILPIKF